MLVHVTTFDQSYRNYTTGHYDADQVTTTNVRIAKPARPIAHAPIVAHFTLAALINIIIYLPERVCASLAMQSAARASIGSDCESYTYLHECVPVLRCSQQSGQVLVQTVNHIPTCTSVCKSCDAVSSQGKYWFRLWIVYLPARVCASLAMQSAVRASIGSDCESYTCLHECVPLLRCSQQPGQVLVQTVNHIPTCTSMCQSCDAVSSQGKYWFRLWIVYLPARVCASLAIQSASRASIG